MAATVVAAAPAAPAPAMPAADLEAFLVNFVVEETGYPPEIVELDADLEGDLGIDSIKKAQLFGELGEHFQIVPDESLSLDDFTTLRHVLQYIEQALSGSSPAPAPSAPAPVPPAAPAVPLPESLPASPPEPQVAAAPAVVATAPAVVEAPLAAPSPAMPTADLEAFLVNFVVEETGYPPEIVELDADLEGDLGIDSIKKAQLFGELGEHFKIVPDESLSLDDFTTLRHVLQYIEQALSGTTPAPAESAPPAAPPALAEALPAEPRAAAWPAGSDESSRIAPVPSSNGQPAALYARVSGSPFEMGFQHGTAERDAIRRVLRWLADAANNPAAATAPRFQVADDPAERFDAAELEELRGIAKGAEVPLENMFALNTLLHEASRRSVLLAATSATSPTGQMLHATGEQLAELAGLSGIARFAQVRFPAGGVPCAIASIPGQLGGLCGVNGHGIVVSGTRLDAATADHQTGKALPLVVKAVLEQADTVESAIEIVRRTQRSGAAGLCVSQQSTDRLCYIEFDGDAIQVVDPSASVVATNHNLLAASAAQPSADSQQRLNRAKAWYDRWATGGTFEQLQSALWHDFDSEAAGNGSNGKSRRRIGVILRPATGEMWLADGQGHAAMPRFTRIDLSELNRTREPEAPPAPPSSALRPPASALRVMKRFILRMSQAPVKSDPHAALDFQGPAVILGNNRRADALRARLMQLGCIVYDLPDGNNPDAAVAALEDIWRQNPAPHLFLMTGCNDLAGEPWELRAADALLVPFEVCRRWTELVEQHNLQPRSTLVAVTMLGGDFGFQGGTPNVLGGIAGMLKAVRREYTEMGIKIIDVAPEDKPVTTADAVVTELASRAPEMEVGYRLGQRWLVSAVEQPAAPATAPVRPSGVWVVTGGARGVTAIVARELGRRYGVQLHLLGSSPLRPVDPSWRDLNDAQMDELKVRVMREASQAGRQPVEAWERAKKDIEIDRNLRDMQAAGVQAAYHCCDVTDRQQLARVLDEIRQTGGPIEGILHGAGVDFSCRFSKKKRENVALTIGSKVDGALALVALTRNDPLRHFIGFGSNSGRFGGHGQADYALASDMLCKLSGWIRRARPGCAACSFHWPSWSEVGMAMRPAIKAGLERSGLGFLPPAEGVEHLIDELEAGLPEQEVLIIDGPHFLDLDGTMSRTDASGGSPAVGATGGSATSAFTPTGTLVDKSPTAPTAASLFDTSLYPLINSIEPGEEPGSYVARSVLDPVSDLFLAHHRLQGKPFLSAVTTLELFAEAVACIHPDKTVVGVSDMAIAGGFSFHKEEPHEFIVRAKTLGQAVRCELVADLLNSQGRLLEADHVFSTGTVELGDQAPLIESPPPGSPVFPYADFFYPSDNFMIYHGECYRTLKQTAFQHDGGRAVLVARAPLEMAASRQGTRWIVPTAMVDGCLVACGTFSFVMLEGRVEIPVRYGRVRLVRLPRDGEQCIQRFYFRGIEDNGAIFDCVLFGDDDRPIFVLDGYRTARIDTLDAAESNQEIETVLGNAGQIQ